MSLLVICIEMKVDYYTVMKPYTAKLFEIWIENFQFTFELLKNPFDVNQVSMTTSE